MLAAVLLFLKANWKWVAIGAAILALMSYIGVIKLERDHYESAYDATKLKLDTLVSNSKAREDALTADNKAITAKYASTLKDANTLTTENARLAQERIASDKETAAVRLSLNAVRLFNASKQPAVVEAEPAAAVQGNAGEAATPAAAAPAEPKVDSGLTLRDLLLTVAINDANHNACVDALEAWQHFWSDYTAAVAASKETQQ